MRVSGFELVNYKGVALAKIENVHGEPVVLISGRNGTGKSLVLEALVSIWTGRYSLEERVGPWGDTAHFELSITLTDNEFAAVQEWAAWGNRGEIMKQDRYTIQYDVDRRS